MLMLYQLNLAMIMTPITGQNWLPIPTQKHIPITLFKVATCTEQVGGNFVYQCMHTVHTKENYCIIIKEKWLHHYIKLPYVVKVYETACCYSLMHLVLQVYGLLDVTHIPKLTDSCHQYFNYKAAIYQQNIILLSATFQCAKPFFHKRMLK